MPCWPEPQSVQGLSIASAATLELFSPSQTHAGSAVKTRGGSQNAVRAGWRAPNRPILAPVSVVSEGGSCSRLTAGVQRSALQRRTLTEENPVWERSMGLLTLEAAAPVCGVPPIPAL